MKFKSVQKLISQEKLSLVFKTCNFKFPFHFHFLTVCRSIEIRNSLEELNRLKGCKVIEGYLSIVFLERSDESYYADYEFPLLTEITEFLLIHRVLGLTSIGKFFPNLRIIRGNVLINNYAFIIWDMPKLQVKWFKIQLFLKLFYNFYKKNCF